MPESQSNQGPPFWLRDRDGYGEYGPDAVNDLRNVFKVLGEETVSDDQLTDILRYRQQFDNNLLAMHREFITALPGSISPDDLLAAVRGMSHAQRSEFAELLGLPMPKHPFLWLPSRDGFAAPQVEFGQ